MIYYWYKKTNLHVARYNTYDVIFRTFGSDVTMMTSLSKTNQKKFDEHQPACRIW